MAMAPRALRDAAESNVLAYICADVRSSVLVGSYELFVAKRRTIKALAFEDVVIMEYDSTSRYYYIRA